MKDINDIPTISSEKIAAFLDGNISADDLQTVLNAIESDDKLRELLEISQKVDADLALIDRNDILPMTALAAHSANQNACALICEMKSIKKLGIDINEEDMLNLAKKKKWFKKGGVALYNIGRLAEQVGLVTTRKFKCKIDDIKDYLDKGACVIAMVDEGELGGYTHEELLEDLYKGQIPDHSVLVMSVDESTIQVYDPAPDKGLTTYNLKFFISAWNDSKNYCVFISKPGALPYIPHPIDLSDVHIDESLHELIEAIAENAHEDWAKRRQSEGWTYGPQRNDQLKQTPDMRPYSLLPDSEKEYDRGMATNIIKLLNKLGYDIVKR